MIPYFTGTPAASESSMDRKDLPAEISTTEREERARLEEIKKSLDRASIR